MRERSAFVYVPELRNGPSFINRSDLRANTSVILFDTQSWRRDGRTRKRSDLIIRDAGFERVTRS